MYEGGGAKLSGTPSPDWEETTEQPEQGWWHASCERCISLAKPEVIDLGGAWNVISLSEVRDKRTGQWDRHLPQFSVESCSFRVSVRGSLRSEKTWERMDQWGSTSVS